MIQRPSTFSLISFLKVTRTGNLFIVAFAQIMTAIFVLNKEISILFEPGFFLLLLTTGSVAAAGYLINDYYDVKIDLINKPDRVVIGRTLKRRSAMALHLFLTLFALIVGLYLSVWIFIIHLISSTLLWWYSNYLKRLPFWGNLIIALLTGATVGIVGVYYQAFPWSLHVYAVFAFFFTLLREIVKDIEDRMGDKEFGCRTLPIIWGVHKTKKFIYFLMILFSLILLTINFPFDSITKLSYILVVIFVQVFYAVLLFFADKTQDFARLSSLAKWIIVTGIASMVINSWMTW